MISDPSLEWAGLPTTLYIVKPKISVVKKLVHPPVCHGGFSCLVAGSHLLTSPTERARFQRDPSALPARDPPKPTSPLVSVSTLQQEEWNATALMYYELGINLLFFFFPRVFSSYSWMSVSANRMWRTRSCLPLLPCPKGMLGYHTYCFHCVSYLTVRCFVSLFPMR